MNAEELIDKIYNESIHGNLNTKGVVQLIEEFYPEYKSTRIAAQYGKEARDMFQCVEKALRHFNTHWDDPDWMYFTIGGKKTCQDVLIWLNGVIKDHINYQIEHADD